jgi:hypothetical protein
MNRRGETTDDPADVCNKPDRQTSNSGSSPSLRPWQPECIRDAEKLIVEVARLAHGDVTDLESCSFNCGDS